MSIIHWNWHTPAICMAAIAGIFQLICFLMGFCKLWAGSYVEGVTLWLWVALFVPAHMLLARDLSFYSFAWYVEGLYLLHLQTERQPHLLDIDGHESYRMMERFSGEGTSGGSKKI